MARKTTNDTSSATPRKTAKPGREDRLKAALKANMARRKAQARARTESTSNAASPEVGGTDAGSASLDGCADADGAAGGKGPAADETDEK
ncbi:hypothetical protein [Gymnodinialimonas ceratoperidinii]|uniref:Uncharacterized protein n=1 Tax=Gymnodinialimonas ceratoperidinii TaxID=2856823 RepID=A0A8F6TZH3_9RHOB|nr:hypothetical protein [Gymnodinialimonas ceratoperidinii]QXT41495.1 hypothetical protein KYE46_07895 [Gymnodinialimonas ceratoperidinii]